MQKNTAPKSRPFYTENDVREILKKSRLSLKTSLKDLPLKKISHSLNHYLMLYCAYQATFQEDASPRPKINRIWFADYLASQRREVDEIKKNLKKLQNYSSKLRTCWADIKDTLPKFKYFMRDHYDDHSHLFLGKMLSEMLENKTTFIEGWTIDMLERIKKTHWVKHREVGPPRKSALIQFTQDVSYCYEDSLFEKPGKDWRGPFGRFLYYCLEHIGINEYRLPDSYAEEKYEQTTWECPGNYQRMNWEICQEQQSKQPLSDCPKCPYRNSKPLPKTDKSKPTLDKMIKTALQNR